MAFIDDSDEFISYNYNQSVHPSSIAKPLWGLFGDNADVKLAQALSREEVTKSAKGNCQTLSKSNMTSVLCHSEAIKLIQKRLEFIIVNW